MEMSTVSKLFCNMKVNLFMADITLYFCGYMEFGMIPRTTRTDARLQMHQSPGKKLNPMKMEPMSTSDHGTCTWFLVFLTRSSL